MYVVPSLKTVIKPGFFPKPMQAMLIYIHRIHASYTQNKVVLTFQASKIYNSHYQRKISEQIS